MNKPNKKLLQRVKVLIGQTTSEEELYSLSVITNMYIDKPFSEYKTILETYCDLLEVSIDLDKLETQKNYKK